MHQIQHRMIETNGIRMHVAECGTGPMVLLCHGFPESWFSWRSQLMALAEAGYHAVAPDMRGFGQTERPAEVERYTIFHLVGDMIGLLDALGSRTAVIIGHDMGAFVAWYAALFRPDRFTAVVGVSVPFPFRDAQFHSSKMPQTAEALYYLLYFQSKDAEQEFERDVRLTIRSLVFSGSGDVGDKPLDVTMVPRGSGWLPMLRDPQGLPEWITDEEVDFYVQEYERTGFGGGLNWYRNIDRNWELVAPFADAKVVVPALFVAGARDLAVSVNSGMDPVDQIDEIKAAMLEYVPGLEDAVIIPECGHWVQQEDTAAFNAAIIAFIRGQSHAGSTEQRFNKVEALP